MNPSLACKTYHQLTWIAGLTFFSLSAAFSPGLLAGKTLTGSIMLIAPLGLTYRFGFGTIGFSGFCLSLIIPAWVKRRAVI